MKKLISILSLVVACVATNSHAAIINVQPVEGGFYDLAFNPIPRPSNSFEPHIIQVDVYMDIVSLGPGEDSFGTAAFSFQTSSPIGTIIPSPGIGWNANPLGNTDINGPAPGGVVPVIATNADLGSDSQDLQGILVQMATGAFTNAADQRRNIGEAGSPFGYPVLLGSAFLEWSGGAVPFYFITLDPVQVSVKRTDGTFVAATATTPNVIVGPWDDPEPSSVVLATMGFVSMLLRRRDA
jgi:hypothetical protein